MLSLSWGRLIVATSLLFCAGIAQGAVTPQRIATAIENSEVSTLPNNVHPFARRATDLGAAPADTQLAGMSLRFNMTSAQQAALTQLLSDQQNPASPRYRQWLTPEQFGAQFGLPSADLQKVSSWLKSQGFTVTEVARGGTFIRFTGSVAQAEKAFRTQIHSLSLDGEAHIANLTEPTLPTAIAAVTSSMTGLHDFRPKARVREIASDAVVTPSGASPRYTSSASGNHFIAPGDFYTIYDVNPLIQAGIDGTGMTIAVVGEVNLTASNLSDVSTFRSLAGLSTSNLPIPTFTGGRTAAGLANDLLESELDVEWAGAVAPNAHIMFIFGYDVFDDALTYAIDHNSAPIISASYGECEAVAGASMMNSYSTLLQQANAQGQTLTASSGDDGATDCESSAASATTGLAVDFPAVMPNVTAVGGTMFNDATGTYWNATNGTNMGSVLSYVPELPWNEDVTAGTFDSGGGGVSTFFTKPFWQVGAGVPADASRDVPDISLNAALFHDATLICTSGYCVDGYKNSSGSHDIVGGTSVGSPQFAALLALVEQKIGSRIGNANPTIYALANSALYSSVFHDVTSGNNSSPCTAGTTNCPAGGTIGYTAGVGYDLATGWGSIDATNMANSWNLVTPLISTTGQAISTTALTASLSAVTQGTNINFTATVGSGTSSVTAPRTGTVQFLLDNVALGTPVALSGNVATYALNTTSVSSGAHTVQAAYSGDVTYAGSKGSASVTITSSSPPDFTLTPATTSISATSGTAATGIVFTVTGLNSFTGTVTLSATAPSAIGFLLSPSQIALTNTKTAGTSTLTLLAYTAKSTNGSSATVKHQSPPWYEAGSGVALAGILMLMLPKRRRFMGALVAVISVGMLAVSGCGGGGNTSASGGGGGSTVSTPTGTYTINVSATGTSGSTTVTHTATVTFVVQ